jgi:hypothetical protein
MNRTIFKMSMISVLLALALGLVNAANASAVRSAPPKDCSGSPQPGEAFIYENTNFKPPCYRLAMDDSPESWTSWDATTGFPNDRIQSVWVGPDVTLVLFWHSFDWSDNVSPVHFEPGVWSTNLRGWNRQASAARLQRFPFGTCDSTPDKLILFTDTDFNGHGPNDCTELSTSGYYPNAVAMGFRGRTVSSAINTALPGHDVNFWLWGNKNWGYPMCSGTWASDLRAFTRDDWSFSDHNDTVTAVDSSIDEYCKGLLKKDTFYWNTTQLPPPVFR